MSEFGCLDSHLTTSCLDSNGDKITASLSSSIEGNHAVHYYAIGYVRV
jgi:hypothetical protein